MTDQQLDVSRVWLGLWTEMQAAGCSPILVLTWGLGRQHGAAEAAKQQLLVQEHGWSQPGWNDSAPFAGSSISIFSSCRLGNFELPRIKPCHMFRQAAGVEMSQTDYESSGFSQNIRDLSACQIVFISFPTIGSEQSSLGASHSHRNFLGCREATKYLCKRHDQQWGAHA